jgi:hypothetical protein
MDNPPTLAFILDLLPSEKAEVERWAALEHLAASDNGNERVEMPGCLKRCPHDGGRCHHLCEDRDKGSGYFTFRTCFRELGGMALTKPHDGYPLPGHEPVPDGWTGAWCPEHGEVERVDEDGCCLSCGSTAVGEGAEAALKLLRAEKSVLDAERERICKAIMEKLRNQPKDGTRGIAAWRAGLEDAHAIVRGK